MTEGSGDQCGPVAWRRDASAWAWRIAGWSLEGRAGMGDALVACVVCQKRTYLHAALDRVGEDAGAPMCDAYCNLRAFKDV